MLRLGRAISLRQERRCCVSGDFFEQLIMSDAASLVIALSIAERGMASRALGEIFNLQIGSRRQEVLRLGCT